MANELAPFGITVNTVAPGWIPTERHENDPQEAKDAYLETIPSVDGERLRTLGTRLRTFPRMKPPSSPAKLCA